MGDYSALKIGDLVFRWKYHIPSFLTFLFSESDFYAKKSAHYDDDEQDYDAIGYRTSCSKALEVLNRFGYDLPFFAGVYEQFRDGLQYGVLDYVAMESGGEEAASAYLAKFKEQQPVDDLRDFIGFMRSFLREYSGRKSDARSVGHKLPAFKTFRIFLDFDDLQMYILENVLNLSPSVIRVALLFDEGYVMNYPEVISLLYIRLILEATPARRPVVLDVHEVIESEREVREMHSELALELMQKVNLYNKVFKVLFEQQEDIRLRYCKSQVHDLLGQLRTVSGNYARGKMLEDLVAVLFSNHPDFVVSERRFANDDEEIDLIIRNNVSRPFWLSLSSPLIFVECKNWKEPVGVSELRNFEVKLQNHHPLVKLGLFFAPNGFTRECLTEIRRASRSNYTVKLIDMDAIRFFAGSNVSLVDWLENLISQPV